MIAIIGAGAWGTALAIQAHRAGRRVTLWVRDPARAAAMQASRCNDRLPGIALPAALRLTADAAEAMAGASLVVLVVPTQALAAVLSHLPPTAAPFLLAAKGVEQSSLRLPDEIVAALRPGSRTGILSGPTFAAEVAAGLPAAAVVASRDAALRDQVPALLGSANFRLYAGDDTVGVEVGGAAKNVIAIAAGAVIGAGLGENARAALVTRGLAEIARLAIALGGRAETVAGLSGLGDLLLTCTGAASRNFSFGLALGAGQSAQAVLSARKSVTEGVATAPALVARARAAGVEMPIAEAVARVLAGRESLAAAVERLMGRPRRAE
ncbi:glycerol-3-phosphate dehydrogenase (NAD(P)+) [Humitalea rosea]|uniref:Glycerol-3-phosphate dehydrogenase [NAD(P)+] n=1 Tax=Humitalea rosea TaxID=990373 RepID=A0A2W7IEU4_9PROT|nr:NAD(P)H-dependent glycerol-3-phosphate dehydrogenase [Humitalea rosea]PZW45118.1 glycerol-3-phosphate dehydrogenase (NAD(P)+) [Humitalea rosea]